MIFLRKGKLFLQVLETFKYIHLITIYRWTRCIPLFYKMTLFIFTWTIWLGELQFRNFVSESKIVAREGRENHLLFFHLCEWVLYKFCLYLSFMQLNDDWRSETTTKAQFFFCETNSMNKIFFIKLVSSTLRNIIMSYNVWKEYKRK